MSALELATEMVRTKRITWLAFTREKVRVVAAEFIRMATPVQIRRPQGIRSFACACGSFPAADDTFCSDCGKRIQWVRP